MSYYTLQIYLIGSSKATVNLKGNGNGQVMLHLLSLILNMSPFDDLF